MIHCSADSTLAQSERENGENSNEELEREREGERERERERAREHVHQTESYDLLPRTTGRNQWFALFAKRPRRLTQEGTLGHMWYKLLCAV